MMAKDASNPPVPMPLLLPNLSARDRQPELMDDPALDEGLHRQALRGLERVNIISGIPGLLWRAVRPLTAEITDRPVRVLDVGCGGGDISVALWKKSRFAGRPLQIGGCDISPKAIRMATERAAAARADAEYFSADVLNDDLPHDWDVLYCSLFLHHFDEPTGIRLLANMARSARRMVLVNDLVRGPLGYLMCWFGVRLLTRSPVVHVDGPLSVRAGFQPPEVLDMARRAGLDGATVSRHWPQRLLLTWRKA
jgi:2-polyprenyl-3-methyl-5-hydroxy-6-metoxy-1,4-benzoquinol methylase